MSESSTPTQFSFCFIEVVSMPESLDTWTFGSLYTGIHGSPMRSSSGLTILSLHRWCAREIGSLGRSCRHRANSRFAQHGYLKFLLRPELKLLTSNRSENAGNGVGAFSILVLKECMSRLELHGKVAFGYSSQKLDLRCLIHTQG